ncbi:MAG: Mrp/NBP35 family ATP-binding protein [candidate division WOR-3 bacterium]
MGTFKDVYAKLTQLKDPVTGETLFKLGLMKDISLESNRLTLTLIAATDDEMRNFENMVLDAVKEFNLDKIEINKVYKEIVRPNLEKREKIKERKIEGVKKVIAVGSGKGGVGKSTVAANLAGALSLQGLQVGLFDGDIYGPSISRMFGIDGLAPMVEDNKMIPAKRFGLKIMSMGQLIEEEKPVLWRGPLIHKAYEQFLYDTNWAPLDVLVIDLPPGTGDAQLSAIQLIELDGSIIVTTPQDVSLIEVKKAINMFRSQGVTILGVIENMSYYKCDNCGDISHIFGTGGAKKLQETMDVEILGELPVHPLLSISGDEGLPIIFREEDNEPKRIFFDIARKIINKLEI